MVDGAALEKRMGLCQAVICCDTQPHFVSSAGHNQRLSHRLVTPYPTQFVINPLSNIGLIRVTFEKVFTSCESRNQLHFLAFC